MHVFELRNEFHKAENPQFYELCQTLSYSDIKKIYKGH